MERKRAAAQVAAFCLEKIETKLRPTTRKGD